MRFIGYNFLPICFLALAAFLVYTGKPYYGWCIFAAIISGVMPTDKIQKK